MLFVITMVAYLLLVVFVFTHTNIHTRLATHGFQLLFTEQAVSVASCPLGDPGENQKTYYILGTAFVDPNEKEPTHGRILVLQVTKSESHISFHQQIVYFNDSVILD